MAYTVSDLSTDQMIELKQNYLFQHLEEVEGRAPSWMELAEASETVPDWIIFDTYAGYSFEDDDFSAGGGAL